MNNARCVTACPTGALVCRESDGTVYIDADKCTGCKRCQEACPHDLLWTDPRTGKTVKCDLCYKRLDEGLQPACVASVLQELWSLWKDFLVILLMAITIRNNIFQKIKAISLYKF